MSLSIVRHHKDVGIAGNATQKIQVNRVGLHVDGGEMRVDWHPAAGDEDGVRRRIAPITGAVVASAAAIIVGKLEYRVLVAGAQVPGAQGVA